MKSLPQISVVIYLLYCTLSMNAQQEMAWVKYDDRHPDWTYQGFNTLIDWEGAYESTLSISDGDTMEWAEFSFVGTQVKLMIAKYWNGGTVNILLDGEILVEGANVNADEVVFDLIFASDTLANLPHTLRLEVITGRSAIDYIEVFQDSDSQPSLSSLPNYSLSLNYKGEGKRLLIDTEGEWRLNGVDTWVTIDTLSGSGEMQLMVQANENTGLSPRRDTLFIDIQGEPDREIYIHQQAAPDGDVRLDFPLMGINVMNAAPFSDNLYFNDLSQQGTKWQNSSNTGGIEFDAAGYPTSIGNANQGLSSQLIIPLLNNEILSGQYTLLWQGKGTIELTVNNKVYSWGPESSGKEVVNISSRPEGNPNSISLSILSSTPGDHIRNIKLLLPNAENDSSFFSAHFKNLLAPFDLIRFMDWNHTNGSKQIKWGDRAQLFSATWDAPNGVPYEIMIDLCNELNKDMWVNIPHQANQEYIRQLALLIKDRLDPQLRIWVEYSNEAWNQGFDQFKWLESEAAKIGDSEGIEGFNVYNMYGRKVIETCEIFESEFAQDERVICILAGESDWAFPLQQAALEIDRQNKRNLVEAMAIAPYFGTSEESKTMQLLDEALPNLNESDFNAILAEIEADVDRIFSGQGDYGTEMKNNKEIADEWGVPLMAYEGGQHLAFWQFEDIPKWANSANQINSRPEMYDIYKKWLDSWRDAGFSTMVPWHLSGLWLGTESFGHLRSFDQDLESAHKYRALLDWLNENVSTDLEQPNQIFENGAIIYPNPSKGILTLEASGLTSNKLEISLFDSQGRVVWKQTEIRKGQKLQLNLNPLNMGLYFLHLDTGQNVEIHKIIINE